MTADGRNQDREKKVTKKSPVSEEAKEQRIAGKKSAPRGEGETGGTTGQSRQGSRRNEGHGPEPTRRRNYEEGHAPSKQGADRPAHERGADRDSLQGYASESRTTSKGSRGGRGEDEATKD